MKLDEKRYDGRVDWITGFDEGSNRITLNIRWSTGRQGWIDYVLQLFIKGSADTPFID